MVNQMNLFNRQSGSSGLSQPPPEVQTYQPKYSVNGTIRFTIVDNSTAILDQISLRADPGLYYQAINDAGLNKT